MSAYWFAVYVVLTDRKWADLLSLSTTTQAETCCLFFRGNPVTKSMAMSSYFHYGILSGCNKPASRWCSAFTCWHTRHLDTYSSMSFFIPIHKYSALRSWVILVIPGWTEYGVVCSSSKTSSEFHNHSTHTPVLYILRTLVLTRRNP